MALIGLLIAIIILILFWLASNFSPLKNDPPQKTPAEIQNQTQDVINSVNERTNLEKNQVKDLDNP